MKYLLLITLVLSLQANQIQNQIQTVPLENCNDLLNNAKTSKNTSSTRFTSESKNFQVNNANYWMNRYLGCQNLQIINLLKKGL